MDINSINSSFHEECTQEMYKEKLKNKLIEYGFTDEELNAIDKQINTVSFTVVHSEEELNTIEDELVKEVSEESNSQLNLITEIQEEIVLTNLEDAYISKYENDNIIIEDFFNIKEENKIYKEPIVSTKIASNFNIDDSHYSLLEDYPNSYGFIDINGNFYKINLSKNQIDFVHSSGTSIKIDNFGNVTLNVNGSLKQVVNGDFILKIKGSFEQQIGEQLYITTGNDKTEIVGGNNLRKSGGLDITKASGILHN